MKTVLIASTIVNPNALRSIGYVFDEPADSCIDVMSEVAGRNCYQSWHRPNPATRENSDYLSNMIQQGHTSVLAHNNVTFYIECSRSCATQMIRSRFLAFSELSQRFVDMSDTDIEIHPAIKEPVLLDELDNILEHAKESYERIVDSLVGKGLTRKQAREAARGVLPIMTQTKLIVSGNIRAWRDFISQRDTRHADAEIRELAQRIRADLEEIAPNSMQHL